MFGLAVLLSNLLETNIFKMMKIIYHRIPDGKGIGNYLKNDYGWGIVVCLSLTCQMPATNQ
jgi:hypothetical protein